MFLRKICHLLNRCSLNGIQSNLSILPMRTYSKCNFDTVKKRSDNAAEWIKTLDTDKQQMIEYINSELILFTQQNQKVPQPEWLSIQDYVDMLEMTATRRRKYYTFIYSRFRAIENVSIRNIIRSKLKAERELNGEVLVENRNKPGHIEYGLGKNSLLIRITEQKSMKMINRNLLRGYLANEPPLIFDCSFTESMTKREIEATAKHLRLAFSALREDYNPFVMHLCNLHKNNYLYNRLKKNMQNLEQLPIRICDEDVTDLYSAENLVYLTPDAENILQKIEPNTGYIVGAIVDLSEKFPMTLAKSKRLNIRTARLPIDKFVKFKTHKALCLNHITQILLEVKRSNDWKRAFMHIPKRKLL